MITNISEFLTSDFDIFILAGQSNAEGNGLGNEELIYPIDKRIFQIKDVNPTFYKKIDGKDVLQIVLPMEMKFDFDDERDTEYGKASSFVNTFSRLYIKNGYLKGNRKILLLRTAVGGTGFSRNEWGINGFLYKRMCDLVDYALKLGGDNKIVSLLWHQGEHDSFEQPKLSTVERFDYYYNALSIQMNDFLNKYGKNIPIIAGDYCDTEKQTNPPAYKAVFDATKKYLDEIPNGGYVESEGLLSNEQKIHNGDTAHFCREACIELGKSYFNEFERIISK